jgi:hypothetical protein
MVVVNATRFHAPNEVREFERRLDVFQNFHQPRVVLFGDGFLVRRGERRIDTDFGSIANDQQRSCALIPQQPVQFRLLGGILLRDAFEVNGRFVFDGQDSFKTELFPRTPHEVCGVTRLRIGNPFSLRAVESHRSVGLQPTIRKEFVGASAHQIVPINFTDSRPYEKQLIMRPG